MSKVVKFHEVGEPDVMKIEQVDVPAPGKGEVQIAIKAIGLNRAEALFRRGQYMEAPNLPAPLGSEAAGTVASVGPDVSGFKVGDAVSVIPAFSFNAYGMYADLANAPAHAVIKYPSSLSFEEAAAIWMQYMTSYGALVEIAGLSKGDAVVIPAASSSVGLAAIQTANRLGAVPIALTRSSSKAKSLFEAGAAHVIATDEQDLVKGVLAATGGMGARVVFDPVGGATFAKLAQATAQHGIVFMYGALEPAPPPIPFFDLLGKGLTIRGYSVREVFANPTWLKKAIEFIRGGLADGSFKPIIAKTFTLDRIVEAHRYLESNQQVGKVIVTT